MRKVSNGNCSRNSRGRLTSGRTAVATSLRDGALGTNGERTVGFTADDLDAAIVELKADVEVDDTIAANERVRYVHFRAPDGRLYELVEVLTA